MFEAKSFKSKNTVIQYVIDFPENFDKSKKYPVIFYFHGMGMVRNGIGNVKKSVPVRREYMPDNAPFIIVAPYCECYTWLECFESLTAFIDHIIDMDFVDSKKVCMTGSSMGGYTCWAQAVMYPEKFAAAVICCGGGFYFAADRIKFPVWAFHGKLDGIVLPRESEIMVEKINKSGGNAKLTIVENCYHEVWETAFKSHDTYRWISEQINKRN